MKRGGGYYYRTLDDFKQGIISSGILAGRGEAPPNALLDCFNIRLNKGTVTIRGGQKYLDEDIYVDETINGLYQYARQYTPVGGGVDVYTAYVFAAGTKLYLWDGVGDDTIWDITAGLGIDLDNDDIYCCIYLDWLYITNGVDIIKTDGTSGGTILLSSALDIANPTVPLALSYISGANDGYRNYKYRYVKRDGDTVIAKSAFSTLQQSALLTDDSVSITYTASPDPDCTHIEIWATELYTIVGSPNTQYYRIFTALNVNGTVVDNLNDETLRAYYTEYTGDDSIGNLKIHKLVFYKDRLFGIDMDDPSLARYSEIGQPEAWNFDSWVDVKRDDGDYLEALATSGQTIYFLKNRSIWSLTGDPDSIPLIQAHSGSDQSSNQTEYGIGCTSARSVVSLGDMLIFYSKYHGVLSLIDGVIQNISGNIMTEICGYDKPAGAVYKDNNGDLYYILSLNDGSGIAYACNLTYKTWVKDNGINVPCWCIDSTGRLVGGYNGRINEYYTLDDTDNTELIEAMMRTHWLNLQDGNQIAEMRNIFLSAIDSSGFFTIQAFNQDDQQPIDTFAIASEDSESDFKDGCYARLLSMEITWTSGSLESIMIEYKKRRRR